MFGIIGIPLIIYMCYKFACSTIFDVTNESKAQFGQTMFGVITAQNFCAVVLIVIDLLLGCPTYLAIISVLICFECTAIEVVSAKNVLMGEVSLFESKKSFHERLRRGQ